MEEVILRLRWRLILIIVFVLLFILAPTLARWYTDWLWFGELGYRRVFWIPLLSRIGVTLVTPFGPLGLDYAYGFDKRPPGWQLHFKFGQGF